MTRAQPGTQGLSSVVGNARHAQKAAPLPLRLPLPPSSQAIVALPALPALPTSVWLPSPPDPTGFDWKSLLPQLHPFLIDKEQQSPPTSAPPPPPPIHETEKKTTGHASLRRIGLQIKVGNASLKRLLSGAFSGAVSRTAVAPLETIRTHLMVGNTGKKTVSEVFTEILQTEGWQGLFRGNGINVIRVAPNKAIELFAYDTVKKLLTSPPGEASRIPLPASSVAGAVAGICSTLCTYPLELLKTRLTIQRGEYTSLVDAFVRICREEGVAELYRGLTPSLIGVVPYAATNYFAYDTLKKLYRRVAKRERIGNIQTLLIGSAAAAIASSATFPLEVARKQMQVGRLAGRQVYRNVFHALSAILEQEGPAGLYRGLGPSCFKLIPAAGISFMCYEACKQILIEEEENRSR